MYADEYSGAECHQFALVITPAPTLPILPLVFRTPLLSLLLSALRLDVARTLATPMVPLPLPLLVLPGVLGLAGSVVQFSTSSAEPALAVL